MKRAGVFDQLLGISPPRNLVKPMRACVIVGGREITDLRQLPPDERTPEVRAELKRAYYRAKYQRDRLCPEKMAKRQAWLEANREKVRAWKKRYDRRTKKHQRQLKADWQRRNYHANAETMRARSRAWYAANRDQVLAKKKAKAAAARQARETAQ